MMEDKISMMPTTVLHTAAPFKTLFPIKENVLCEIAEDMKQNGFDYAHPIIIWAGHKVTVVDGHTRLAAAQKIHLNMVPVTLKNFVDEEDALQYAIRSQCSRRNLTDAELAVCIKELDCLKTRGGKPKASREAFGKSANKTAELLGISRAKVERIRAVNDYASDSTKSAVAAGKMSINKAYNTTMKQKRNKKSAEQTATPEDPAAFRIERLNAVKKNLLGQLKTKLEQENQEYPDLHYTIEEKNQFLGQLTDGIAALIEQLLPYEK